MTAAASTTRGAKCGTCGAGRGTRRSLVGLLTATGASVAANAMVAVRVPWLVLSRTGSPAQAGPVGAMALAELRGRV